MGSAHSPSQMYGKAALALARSFTLLLFILGLSSPHARAEFLRSADFQAGGSLDLYYAYNFNTPPPVEAPTDTDLSAPPGQNAYRIFDLYHDDMSLALAEVHLRKTDGPVTAYLSLGAGSTADVLSPRDEVSKHVLQAHVTYVPEQAPRWSFTAGKMNTHMGLEYTKTSENWQYSRSTLFGYALPFWHTGVGISNLKRDLWPDHFWLQAHSQKIWIFVGNPPSVILFLG